MVDRVVNRKYLGRSALKAFGPERLLKPRREGIVYIQRFDGDKADQRVREAMTG